MDYKMKIDSRRWWLKALLTAIIPLTMACSVGDADGYDAEPQYDNVGSMTAFGLYEGEWTVNKQVVDTARLVVNGNMIQLRLPERYLLSCIIPDYTPDKADSHGHYDVSNIPTKMQLTAQGYSEQSQYMSFASATLQVNGMQQCFNICSFEANLDNVPCLISLLSKENATAIIQNTTGQWTIGIPISGFRVTNLSSGESTLKELPYTITIYYNTKRRIG